jgi:hypothetical protein
VSLGQRRRFVDNLVDDVSEWQSFKRVVVTIRGRAVHAQRRQRRSSISPSHHHEEVRSKEGLYDPMDIYVHVWGLLRQCRHGLANN